MNHLRTSYLILIIFLLGLFLRLYDLGSESVWYDEAVSIAVAKLGLFDQFRWSFDQNDNNPLFYYEILYFWVWLFGDSEFVVRLPSAIFGSISVGAIYFVGRSLFSKNVGIIAALILAVSDFHIQYSQEARAYSLLALLALVSFYFFLKILSSRRKLFYILYIVSTLLMLYTHYYGFFILAAQNIFILTNRVRNKKLGELTLKIWIQSQIIIFLLYLPAFVLFAKHAIAIQGGFWLPEPKLYLILSVFIMYSGSISLLVVFGIFALFTLSGKNWNSLKSSNKLKSDAESIDSEISLSAKNKNYLLILWLFVPILIPYFISLILTPILYYRYIIAGSLAFYILAARGIEMTGKRAVMLVAVSVIFILSGINVQGYYKNIDKYQWRETMNYLEENALSGDYVTIYPLFEIESAKYYHTRKDLHSYPLTDNFVLAADIGTSDLWVILADHARTDREALEKVLNNRYDLKHEKEFVHLRLYKYSKKKSK